MSKQSTALLVIVIVALIAGISYAIVELNNANDEITRLKASVGDLHTTVKSQDTESESELVGLKERIEKFEKKTGVEEGTIEGDISAQANSPILTGGVSMNQLLATVNQNVATANKNYSNIEKSSKGLRGKLADEQEAIGTGTSERLPGTGPSTDKGKTKKKSSKKKGM